MCILCIVQIYTVLIPVIIRTNSWINLCVRKRQQIHILYIQYKPAITSNHIAWLSSTRRLLVIIIGLLFVEIVCLPMSLVSHYTRLYTQHSSGRVKYILYLSKFVVNTYIQKYNAIDIMTNETVYEYYQYKCLVFV